jgi:hypothetical protein
VLDQAGNYDASVGKQPIEIGAAARTVSEHLAGPARPDRNRSSR